jgi:hypothetical protein
MDLHLYNIEFHDTTRHNNYFEWPLHLQDNLFGRFIFSLDIHILLD